jgi:hypothetical protein
MEGVGTFHAQAVQGREQEQSLECHCTIILQNFEYHFLAMFTTFITFRKKSIYVPFCYIIM